MRFTVVTPRSRPRLPRPNVRGVTGHHGVPLVDQYTFDPAEVAKLQTHQGLTAHTGLTNKGTGIGEAGGAG